MISRSRRLLLNRRLIQPKIRFVCVYVCVYIYLYIYICICVSLYTCTHICRETVVCLLWGNHKLRTRLTSYIPCLKKKSDWWELTTFLLFTGPAPVVDMTTFATVWSVEWVRLRFLLEWNKSVSSWMQTHFNLYRRKTSKNNYDKLLFCK